MGATLLKIPFKNRPLLGQDFSKGMAPSGNGVLLYCLACYSAVTYLFFCGTRCPRSFATKASLE